MYLIGLKNQQQCHDLILALLTTNTASILTSPPLIIIIYLKSNSSHLHGAPPHPPLPFSGLILTAICDLPFPFSLQQQKHSPSSSKAHVSLHCGWADFVCVCVCAENCNFHIDCQFLVFANVPPHNTKRSILSQWPEQSVTR